MMPVPVDLDAIKAALAAPHVIELRADGWTLMHPLSCRPNLFSCQINQAADHADFHTAMDDGLQAPGRFEVELCDGALILGGPVEGDLRDPIDVPAMAAELRALRGDLESHHRYIADLTGDHACRLCATRGRRD